MRGRTAIEGETPHAGTTLDAGSTPAASTEQFFEQARLISYPCCAIINKGGTTSVQCHGTMQRHRNRFRDPIDGQRWARFTCDRCGRKATDLA